MDGSKILLLALFCVFHCSAAADHHHSSSIVVGTVYCNSISISGASVAIECYDSAAATPNFRKEVKTNARGVFRAQLPSKIEDAVTSCSVKMVRTDELPSASAELRLKSVRNGVRVFAAAFFFFPPPIPFLPSPPNVGGIPLPLNPLVPPPSLLPPVFPSPPPSLLPPVLPSPPPAPLIGIPPLPFVTPPSPPPPASIFPPLPPLFPGIPPASP